MFKHLEQGQRKQKVHRLLLSKLLTNDSKNNS